MRKDTRSNVIISLAALAVLAVKLAAPDRVDVVAVALLVVALLPWLSAIVERADMPGGGSIVLRQVQAVKAAQRDQQDQIDNLAFLFEHLVSRDELDHLSRLRDGTPFGYGRDETRPFLELELRRLTNVGLIGREPARGIRTMGDQGDVRDHFHITQAGRRYLDILTSFSQPVPVTEPRE
jgi:hypothetical protein